MLYDFFYLCAIILRPYTQLISLKFRGIHTWQIGALIANLQQCLQSCQSMNWSGHVNLNIFYLTTKIRCSDKHCGGIRALVSLLLARLTQFNFCLSRIDLLKYLNLALLRVLGYICGVIITKLITLLLYVYSWKFTSNSGNT